MRLPEIESRPEWRIGVSSHFPQIRPVYSASLPFPPGNCSTSTNPVNTVTLLLDAVGTLIQPSEPVGRTYAGHLAAATGISVEPTRMQSAFLDALGSAATPDYSLHPFGHAAEYAWWRDLVSSVLQSLGGEAAQFAACRLSTCDLPTFDSYFESLFTHYADPDAWVLFPEVLPFLAEASKLGTPAVVSNFDDRLAPILAGLGTGPFLKDIFTSADARARKPDRALFSLALDRLNSSPGEAIH
ncbi:MAG: hypothetical protein GWO24_28670, partial [Akkermansiaceae bacterium]|nr:hypothetical protein [Akkermansiaceae bacterium]